MPLAQLLKAGRSRLLGPLNASVGQIGIWTKAFQRAEGMPSDPLPCPDCFLEGKVGRLVPMHEPAPCVAAVVCSECHRQIEYSDI